MQPKYSNAMRLWYVPTRGGWAMTLTVNGYRCEFFASEAEAMRAMRESGVAA